MAGKNLNLFVMDELPLVSPGIFQEAPRIEAAVKGLCEPHSRYATSWLPVAHDRPWKQYWATTKSERLRLSAMMNAVVAFHYGIDQQLFSEIVRDCDYPSAQIEDRAFNRTLDPKGFWRFEKSDDPELRSTVLSQVAFADLRSRGLRRFLGADGGQGWLLPEALRLRDYGLGHDDHAKELQPVASRLGPRFYDWQVDQSVEESWEECERHAEILARLLPPLDPKKETPPESGVAGDLFGNPIETDLFGSPVYPKPRKR